MRMNAMQKEQDAFVQYLVSLLNNDLLHHALLLIHSSLNDQEYIIQKFLNVAQPSEVINIHNEDEDRKSPVITVKQIHELRQKLSRKSQSGRLRVILIPYAEELTAESGNALLKILEEPPIGTLFLLKALSRLRVLPTIVSRCAVIKMPEDSCSSSNSGLNLDEFLTLPLAEKMMKCQSLTKSDMRNLLGEFEREVLSNSKLHSKQGVVLYRELLHSQMGTNGLREQSMQDVVCLNTSI